MTGAPTPGISKQRAADEAAQSVLRIRLRDETLVIAAANVPIRVKDRFMQQTGRAFEWYADPSRLGDVSLCGLWFLAKLIDGEDVTWDQMLDRWDEAKFTADDIEVIEETAGESEHPEA